LANIKQTASAFIKAQPILRQHWIHKTKDKDKHNKTRTTTEKQATLGTQDKRQTKQNKDNYRETGSTVCTRQKTKTNKTKQGHNKVNYRETGNTGYTRQKTKTNKTKQNKNTTRSTTEKQATLGTQDKRRRQNQHL
jgi:hypothetical protein